MSIRELFGMAGGPRSRPWGINSGLVEGVRRGSGGPELYNIGPDVHQTVYAQVAGTPGYSRAPVALSHPIDWQNSARCASPLPSPAPGRLKPFKFVWCGATDIAKPCEFMLCWVMDITKPFKFICSWAMDVHNPILKGFCRAL